MSLQSTPSANRLHIGIFGKRNSGKSSLMNEITNQQTALVSKVKGTTTDPVIKAMEITGIGACCFIDTAGFDDVGQLGQQRIKSTKKVLQKTQIALLVIDCNDIINNNLKLENEWINQFNDDSIPYIIVINKIDLLSHDIDIVSLAYKLFDKNPILVSASEKKGIDNLKNEIVNNIPKDFDNKAIVKHLVKKDDVVLLVMPQDIQAPQGRLILPQVQTIRELLDNSCVVICVTEKNIDTALSSLVKPPVLIITDSQCFKAVYEKKPKESLLTSFSVLFAAFKGDINEFIKGALVLDNLNENSNILIAEACTHTPQNEDIGRVKIPNMLKKKFGEKINITVVNGNDFPDDLKKYDLIIHCGACMFNRQLVLNRVKKAVLCDVPITNYGIVIAYLSGILDKIIY